uniref:Uncharacterized protein n=1 Tax=Oryza barthii TaxID=65489 RepID=A0A0D3HCH6_9ORYZ
MLASPSRYLGPDPRGEERLDKPKGCPHVSPFYNAADPIIINGKGIDPFELSEEKPFIQSQNGSLLSLQTVKGPQIA